MGFVFVYYGVNNDYSSRADLYILCAVVISILRVDSGTASSNSDQLNINF